METQSICAPAGQEIHLQPVWTEIYAEVSLEQSPQQQNGAQWTNQCTAFGMVTYVIIKQHLGLTCD